MSKAVYPVQIAFDIGHSSIGWAVLNPTRPDPEILGCGTVIFPKDDCLASARRGHRRTRRNIRATRQRIARMKSLLLHLGVLDIAALDAPGHPAPHVLAARALISPAPLLDWRQLWDVVRWYAHNRGYDGNARWAREGQEDETEKEAKALELMEQHGTRTMAETVCSVLGIRPSSSDKISSCIPFKIHNAAFPRPIVQGEVLAILEKHVGHLPALTADVIECFIQRDVPSDKSGWKRIPVPGLHLPKRYQGGLLFGQLVPRFDNRIIGTCPISGEKLPVKNCREFLAYRWAMLVANLRVRGYSLTVEHRQSLNDAMKARGRMTPSDLHKLLRELTGASDKETNIRAMFEIHPDSKDALSLDPCLAYFEAAAEPPRNKDVVSISRFWPHLPTAVRNRALGRWRKGRPVDLQWMQGEVDNDPKAASALEEAINAAWAADQKKSKPQFISRDHLLRRRFSADVPSGRAPYARPILREVVDFVFTTDRNPTEAVGPIYRSGEILRQERNRRIEDLTNNHLIRQRLSILQRLTDDIVTAYAANDPRRIEDIVVEVARDLQEYSGLTAKEMAGELTKRLSHFKSAVDYLQKNAPELPINGSLIRKCRIAMDLDWTCPFTGRTYMAHNLSELEREHIIPYTDRPTNALDAQVLTFPWVNKLKAKRTALQFIMEIQGDDRFQTPQNYKKWVDALKVARRETYPDDYRRQSARKRWLLVEEYKAGEHGFTQGALTQTSHLNRLAHRQLERQFVDARTGEPTAKVHAIPGQITAEARKAWNLLGTLVPACPECAGKQKTEIREITHLHHALDAATLALVHHYLPGRLPGQPENQKGLLWQALLRRRKTLEEIELLTRTGVIKKTTRTDREGTVHADALLVDLPTALKHQLAERLKERRVVQHVPADQSGALLELNPWRVSRIDGDPSDPMATVHLQQRTSTVENGKRLVRIKKTTEKAGKLIGLRPGKLHRNKSVLVIAENYGIALEPFPSIVPFHQVSKRLSMLRRSNHGQTPRILRNGMLLRIREDDGRFRLRRIFSAKAPAYLDLADPDAVKMQSRGERYWRQVSVVSLLKSKSLEIVQCSLTGVDPEVLTDSNAS